MEITIKFDPNTMQQGPYPFTGSGQLNQMISALAPMLIGGGMGMANPMMAAHTPLGVSPRLAEMARAQNVFRDAYMKQTAGDYRERLADQGVALGLHRDLKVPASDLRAVIENLPVERLSGLAPVRAISGGDPMALAERAYEDRSMFVRTPQSGRESDFERTELLRSEMATDYRKALEEMIRPARNGGLTPDFTVTRGLSDDDVHKVVSTRFQRSGMTMDADAAELSLKGGVSADHMKNVVEGGKEALKTVAELMGVLGSTEAGDAHRALDKFYGSAWITGGDEQQRRLRRSFQRLGAYGDIGMGLGAGQMMVPMAMQGADMVAGLGYDKGGAGAQAWGAAHARLSADIARTRDVDLSDPGVQADTARATAMLAASPANRRGEVLTWLKTEGHITDESYTDYLQTMREGSATAVAESEKKLFQEAAKTTGRSVGQLYGFADNVAQMRRIRGRLSAPELRDDMEALVSSVGVFADRERQTREGYEVQDLETRRIQRRLVDFKMDPEAAAELELTQLMAQVADTDADAPDIRELQAYHDSAGLQQLSPRARLDAVKTRIARGRSSLQTQKTGIYTRTRLGTARAREEVLIRDRFGGDADMYADTMARSKAMERLLDLTPHDAELKDLVGAVDLEGSVEDRDRAIEAVHKYAMARPELRRTYTGFVNEERRAYEPGPGFEAIAGVVMEGRLPGSGLVSDHRAEGVAGKLDETAVDKLVERREFEAENKERGLTPEAEAALDAPGALEPEAERHMGFGQRLWRTLFMGEKEALLELPDPEQSSIISKKPTYEGLGAVRGAAAEDGGSVRGATATPGSENRAMTVTVVGKLFDSRGQQVGTIGSG